MRKRDLTPDHGDCDPWRAPAKSGRGSDAGGEAGSHEAATEPAGVHWSALQAL